jgi:hypothetical protein
MSDWKLTHGLNDKELAQLVRLVKDAVDGASLVDRRRYSRKVLDWATQYNLLEQYGKRLRFKPYSHFRAHWDLPLKALWLMVSEIIGERSGFSVAKQQGWRYLDLWEWDSRYLTSEEGRQKNNERILEVMFELDRAGFIYFQAAGEVWQITRREQTQQAA